MKKENPSCIIFNRLDLIHNQLDLTLPLNEVAGLWMRSTCNRMVRASDC